MIKIKRIKLKSENAKNINTELYFEIASARAENCEIVQICFSDDDKIESAVFSAVKKMKSGSIIQFFAGIDSFKRSDTEAVFLLNKYPGISFEKENDSNYIYVKL